MHAPAFDCDDAELRHLLTQIPARDLADTFRDLFWHLIENVSDADLPAMERAVVRMTTPRR